MDDLNAAKLDDVKDWFRTYYGAANAVLVLAGDIDLHTAKQKVEKYFGDIPPAPGGAAAGVGRQAHREPAGRHAGPGSPGSDLQGLEYPGLGYCRRRLSQPGRATS